MNSETLLLAVTMFARKLDSARMSFVERTMTKMLKVPTGDFRYWDRIREWAREVAVLLMG
jgi:menaquinone-dependent protoporphyrinogen IX oxidase